MPKDKTNKKRESKPESEVLVRLKAMVKAAEAGKLVSLNRHPDNPAPKSDYSDMPDDTIYASL